MTKCIDLVVPCFNESEVLPLFYNEVSAVAEKRPDCDFRFIFVNDGSRDNTLGVLKSLAQKDTRVKYISFSRNFGKESAMLAGLSYSTAELVGILDADLQHSPEILLDMLAGIEAGHDVAAARRVDRAGEAGLKSALSKKFYNVISKISEVDLDEGSQDFRIMKRPVVDAVLSMSEHGRFSKGIFAWVGFDVLWIEHENRERAAGETKWSLRKLMKYAIDGILGFSSVPLKVSIFLSIIFAAVGAGIGIWGIVDAAVSGAFSAGTLAVLAVVLLSTAAILFCLGIIGAYLEKIYGEVKGRPQFIVSDTNFEV